MKMIRGIGFVFLFLACAAGFRWLLVDDTESYTRLMMREFYQQKNIDILFVGSSHCYASLDPEITDAIFEANTFNAGSSLQALDASYALIREAAERYNVRQVYLEMYYLMMGNDDYQSREQLTGTYIVSDYMRPGINKTRFLLQASSPRYYVNSFLPARRYWEKLLRPFEISSLIAKKQSAAYRNYEPVGGYRAKGFVANSGEISGGTLLDTAGFDAIHIENASADWLMTLLEIIRYCEEKGISLTLFSAPMTLFQTAGLGNYDAYIDFMHQLTEGTSARYVDFNLCKETYFNQTPELFSDAGHLNETGAERFSAVFADYFTGKLSDEIFYDSMEEKLDAAGEQILGLSFLDSGDGTRKLKIVSTFSPDTRYTVEMEKADGTVVSLKENSSDLYFEIPQSEQGKFHISAGGISVDVRE